MAANTTKCTLSMTFSHGSSSEHHSKSKRASGTPSIANRLWLRLMLPRSCEDSFASTCILSCRCFQLMLPPSTGTRMQDANSVLSSENNDGFNTLVSESCETPQKS